MHVSVRTVCWAVMVPLPHCTPALNPKATDDLVAFWDFDGFSGRALHTSAGEALELREAFGPVPRSEEGVFGPHAVVLGPGRGFVLPRTDGLGGLDIHGTGAEVTVAAWIKRSHGGAEWCSALAGIWDERHHQRQYALFTGLGFLDVAPEGEVCGHVSDTGGRSDGFVCCNEAAVGTSPVPKDRWCCAAMTYDGREIRAWLDGRFEPRAGRNPWPLDRGIHRPSADTGADFTIGYVRLPDSTYGPDVLRPGCYGNWFHGLVGGIAVWNRALHPDELAGLAPAAQA